MILEKFIPRLFLTFPTKPERFSRLQVGHERQKLLFLPQIGLIHSQLPQRRSASYRCALTGLPYRFLKSRYVTVADCSQASSNW